MRVCILTLIFIFGVAVVPFAGEPVTVNKESGAAYSIGISFYNAGEYERSLELFQKAYNLDQRNVSALFANGLALNKLNRFVEAAGMYEKVLEQESGHEKALKALVAAQESTGDNEKALAACDRGIAAIPDDEYFPLAKARILMKIDKFEDAVPLLEKAHELEPDNLDITEILMQSLVEVSRIDEAYEHAQKILEQDEDNARAHMVAGDYKRLKGDLEEALEEYEAASQDIETKAYAEHYKEVVEQQLEEKEIEEEYEEQLEEDTEDSQESAKSNREQTENKPKKTTSLFKKRGKRAVATQYVRTTVAKNKSGIIMLVLLIVIVFTIVSLQAYTTYRKR